MNLLIAGSIGIDNIETPFGKKENLLGGSGVYASLAASYFAKPMLLSIAGDDLTTQDRDSLTGCGVDLANVEFRDKTFRWHGSYEYDMNQAKTLKTELNSLVDFDPKLNSLARQAKYLLLGNTDPDVQLKIIDQMSEKPFIVLDTMNFWISSKKEQLLKVIKKANLVVVNDGEARQLFNEPNLIKAGHQLLGLGPEYAIIKKGEHGALLFTNDSFFSAPAYPLETLLDPTGCGDSFAGGLVGFLAGQQVSRSVSQRVSFEQMRKAVIYGSCIASFCAEAFGTGYRQTIKKQDIEERYGVFQEIREF